MGVRRTAQKGSTRSPWHFFLRFTQEWKEALIEIIQAIPQPTGSIFLSGTWSNPDPGVFPASRGGSAPPLAEQHMAPCPRTCRQHTRLLCQTPLYTRALPGSDVHLCSRRSAQAPVLHPTGEVLHPRHGSTAALCIPRAATCWPLRIPKPTRSNHTLSPRQEL